MPDLLSTNFLIALAVATVAGTMRGFAGFGSGMLMAPIFAILFGPVETVAIIILMESVVTVQMMPGVRREIDWRFVAPMGLAAMLLMPLGSWLLVTIDAETVSRTMAAIVVGFVVILWTGWRYEGAKPLPVTLAIGGLSGVMMAGTSLGNPPVLIYMLSSRDSAARNRANMTAYFAVTLGALIAIMAIEGLLSVASFVRTAALLPIYMFTTWLGGRAFGRSGEAVYRHVTLAFLFAVGLYGLVR